MAVQIQSFKKVVPMIYAYNTPGVAYHDGWTKVGYTEKQSVEQRIRQQTHTADVRWVLAWKCTRMAPVNILPIMISMIIWRLSRYSESQKPSGFMQMAGSCKCILTLLPIALYQNRQSAVPMICAKNSRKPYK